LPRAEEVGGGIKSGPSQIPLSEQSMSGGVVWVELLKETANYTHEKG